MGEIRIVSGTLKGRVVLAPPGRVTRPLLTRLRKALADILRPRLGGARVLDLFGGSGAIAFELLSNGAAAATVYELDAAAARAIRENGERFQVRVELREQDCLRGIPALAGEGSRFDVIVVAPPYDRGLQAQAMEALAPVHLLAPDGVVVVQRDGREPFWEPTPPFLHTQTRRYGRTVFDFYEGTEG